MNKEILNEKECTDPEIALVITKALVSELTNLVKAMRNKDPYSAKDINVEYWKGRADSLNYIYRDFFGVEVTPNDL